MTRIYTLKLKDRVIYVGATRRTLHTRLRARYAHIREKNRTGVKLSKLEATLEQLLRESVTIHLVEECIDTLSEERERFYIKFYISNGVKLLNTTDGGAGGNTSKYLSDAELKQWGLRISTSNLGKHHSEDTKQKIRDTKVHARNPMFGTTRHKPVRIVGTTLVFNNPCEIDDICGRYNAASNVYRHILKGYRSYGYYWEYVIEPTK